MKEIQPPLTPKEESALRRISDGGVSLLDGTLRSTDLHRLAVLQLIRLDGASWRLTDLGKECALALFGGNP
jgi:hypothetical protein